MPQRRSKDEASVVERSLITELEKRFHAFRLPPHPKSYDPTKVDADRLRKFGIPPRPDKAHQPRLHDLWMTTFGQKLHFVAFKLPTVHMLEAEGFPAVLPADRARAVATRSGSQSELVWRLYRTERGKEVRSGLGTMDGAHPQATARRDAAHLGSDRLSLRDLDRPGRRAPLPELIAAADRY